MKTQHLLIIFFLAASLITFNLRADDSDEYYEQALSAFYENKHDEAIIYLKNVFQQEPNHLPAKVLLGNIYFSQGLVSEAEMEMLDALNAGADINLIIKPLGYSYLSLNKITQLLELDRFSNRLSTANLFEWRLIKAQAYIELNKPIYAQSQFEQAKELMNDKRLLNAYASFLVKQTNYTKAQELLEESFTLDRYYAKTWVVQGQLFLKLDKLNKALEAFERAYTINSEDPVAVRLLAFLNLKVGNLKKAESTLNKVLELFPNDSSAILMKAWLLSNKGENEAVQQSLSELQNRLSLISDRQMLESDSIAYIQGASEFVNQNWEQARTHLTRYLEGNRNHFSTIQMLSQIYYKLDGPESAMRFLESKEKQIIQNLGLSVKLVEFYIETGKISSAREFLKEVAVYFKNNPYINYVRAMIERSRGNDLLALTYLEGIENAANKSTDVNALKIELLFSLNRMDKAKHLIDKILDNEPKNTKANNLLAIYLIKQGQISKALDILNTLLIDSPNDKLSRYNRAVIAAMSQDHGLAIGLLNQLLNEQPNHTSSQLLLIRILVAQSQLDKAQSRALQFLARNSSNIEITELLAQIHIQKKEWQQALTFSEKLLNYNNLNESYIEQNIKILIALERLPELPRKLGVLKGLWQNDGLKLSRLAKLYFQAKDINSAISTLEKAAKLSPNTADIDLLLIQYYASARQFDKANNLVKRIKSEYHDNIQFHVINGDLAVAQNKKELALKHYQKSLVIAPESNLALIKLYQLAKQGTDVEGFTQRIEKKVQKSPKTIWLRRLMADHYLNANKSDLAKEQYEYLITHTQLKNDSLILNNLANLYMDIDLVKAEDYAQQAIALDANNAIVLDTYGAILAANKNYKLALATLRKALSFNANSLQTRYQLAYVLYQSGRVKESKRELEMILSSNLDFTDIEKAKHLLSKIKQLNEPVEKRQ